MRTTDVDQDNHYDVTIVATDSDGNTASMDQNVEVTNIHEPAEFDITPMLSLHMVAENADFTGLTPSITGNPHIGTLTYSITGVDATQFVIDPITGVITMAARNFEAPTDVDQDNHYDVTIVATDSDGNTASMNLMTEVTNIRDFDIAHGEGGNDLLHGAGGDNHIFGGGGVDTIHGAEGNDRLYGGGENAPTPPYPVVSTSLSMVCGYRGIPS